MLAELAPEHFDSELHRRMRARLVGQNGPADDELALLEAELDALAAREAIDERRPRRSCSCGCASATCGGSSPRPISSRPWSSRQALERIHAACHELA